MQKHRRFHIDIYCPEWTRDSIISFCKKLSGTELKCSYHANNKIKRMKRKYRLYIRNLLKTLDISNELYLDYVFEFYANGKNVVKKVCYRLPMKELNSDVIIIVSSTGSIVTVYLNNNFDAHHNLKKELYEQGEINEG